MNYHPVKNDIIREMFLTKTQSCVVEYFDIPDASLITGNRQQRLDGYREVRDLLTEKLYKRLSNYL